MINTIVKRDGRCVLFDIDKITDAIFKAAQALEYGSCRAVYLGCKLTHRQARVGLKGSDYINICLVKFFHIICSV